MSKRYPDVFPTTSFPGSLFSASLALGTRLTSRKNFESLLVSVLKMLLQRNRNSSANCSFNTLYSLESK